MRTTEPLKALFGGALMLSCSAAMAASLAPPPGYTAPVQHQAKKPAACPAPPAPFTGTLDFPSKYEGSGKARDQLNEESDARYKALTAPIREMEKGATKRVDVYMDSGRPEALQCALSWYAGWADAQALLGASANHTGKSMRKWALGSLASAWLRLKFSSSQPLAADPQQAARIEAWLVRVADRVVSEWNPADPIGKINNHYYWAAWSVMATAVVTDRRDLFDWAAGIYATFARQVDAEGYLPNEIARASRAASYQVYAVTPVAMIAAFGKANGVDLAAESNGALQRAAQRALSAYDDPRAFEEKTGQRQTLEGVDEQSAKLAWLEPYCWTLACDAQESGKLASLRPMKNARLGGDLTAVFGR